MHVLKLLIVGIFSDTKITPKGNPLDTLCATLEEKMAYEEGERDFVVSIDYVAIVQAFIALTSGSQFLQHNFEVENKDGSRDTITSTLSEYGAPIGSGGYSAMAKLVGVPCGVGKSSSHSIVIVREWFLPTTELPVS